MLTRRTFLTAGLASTVIAGIGYPALRGAAASATGLGSPLHSVIYDQRYQACNTFAAAAQRLGVSAHSIAGDVTDIWFKQLYHVWKAGTAPVGGMTSPGSLLCLEQMARQFDRRIVFRIDHHDDSRGHIDHRSPWTDDPVHLDGQGTSWPEHAARLVWEGAAGLGRLASPPIVKAPTLGQDALISWVIGLPKRA